MTPTPLRNSLLASLLVAPLAACGQDAAPQTPQAASNASIVVSVAQASVDGPLDAAPAPDASTFYYTAKGSSGMSLFSVPADGGGSKEMAQGFTQANGVVVSSVAQTVYVADSGATNDGSIVAVSEGDGTTKPFASTKGYAAFGLDVGVAHGQQVIVFSGVDPKTAKPGIFSISETPSDDPPMTLATGFPGAVQGVAMTSDQTIYATGDGSDGKGALFEIDGAGAPVEVVSDITLGDPAGVALTMDESSVLVSALDATGHSEVVIYARATKGTTTFDGTIGANTGSGGLHRAKRSDVFAWAGYMSGGQGTVFQVKLY